MESTTSETTQPNRIDRGSLAVAIFFLALGLYLTISSLWLPAGSGSLPGAGFFPRAIGIVIVLLAVTLLFQTFRERAGTIFRIGNPRAVGGTIGLTFLFLAFWGTGWFPLRTFVFLALFLKFLGEKWRQSLTVSGALTAAVTLAFQYGLSVSLE
jgi:hypothetical protein